MTSYFEPLYRQRFYRDHENIVTDQKRYNEVLVFDATTPLWDLSQVLASGETVSSVTWTESGGLSTSDTGNTDTAVYATISYTGSVVVKVTTSTGRVFERMFQWLSTDQPTSDYR